MMNRFWSKCLPALGASVLFAIGAQADLAEFNAINAAARAARERGDQAAYLANVRKLAAFTPGHPAIELAAHLGRYAALDRMPPGAFVEPRHVHRVVDVAVAVDLIG